MNTICVNPCPSVVKKPRKIIVPLAIGLTWAGSHEYIHQEKMDGIFAVREVRSQELGDSILAGEQMRSGEFFAFDCLQFNGVDVREFPLAERLAMLDILFLSHSNSYLLPSNFRIVPSLDIRPSTLPDIFACGGEGIVRKRLDAPWGTPMEACKRLETFICTVTEFNAGQSARIARVISPECSVFSPALKTENLNLQTVDCGSVSLFGGKIDRIRVGSILKIEGFGLTRAGSIREPRPCKDSPASWLIQY